MTTTAAPPPPITAPAPRGRDVLLALTVTLGAMLAFAGVGVLVAATVVGRRYGLVLGVLLGAVGAWTGLWLTLTRRLGWGRQELGFVRGRRPLRHLLWQVPGALAASLVGAALLGASLGLSPGEAGAAERDLLDGADVSPWLLLLVAACVVLVLPAAEEVLFRRVLLDWARARLPAPLDVLLTAVAFAVVHVAPVAMTYLVFVGVFTAVLRIWHGSLWPPLVLHAVNNGLVVLVTVQAL